MVDRAHEALEKHEKGADKKYS